MRYLFIAPVVTSLWRPAKPDQLRQCSAGVGSHGPVQARWRCQYRLNTVLCPEKRGGHLRGGRHGQFTEPLAPDLIQTLVGSSPSTDNADEDELRLMERQLAKLPPLGKDLLRLKYERVLSVVALHQHDQCSESAVKLRLKQSGDRLQSRCVQEGDG